MSISVAANRWPYTVRLPKDPNAVLDYQLDWSGWLADGETISSATVTVAGLTLLTSVTTTTTTTAWVSGGVSGAAASITFHVTTNSAPIGRQDDRTLLLQIAER